MRVLVAEDDRFTREGLAELLESEGYNVVTAADGSEAIERFESHRPDFVCLDIMMPNQSGYEACRRIRKLSRDVPIIFISAKTEETDRLVGFELGADDFISKPFSVREVLARVRAVARRCCAGRRQLDASFMLGNLKVSPAELRASRDGKLIELSPRDVAILELLHAHPGTALDRDTIFRHAWGESYFHSSRTLDQHISQLRKRVELDPKHPRLIQTVHGVGYRFDP